MNLPNHDPQITKCYWRCLNFHCYVYHVSILHIYIFNFNFIFIYFISCQIILISFIFILYYRLGQRCYQDIKEEHNIVVNIALCWLHWPLGRIILLLMSCLTLFQLIIVQTFCSPVHFLYSYLQFFLYLFGVWTVTCHWAISKSSQ